MKLIFTTFLIFITISLTSQEIVGFRGIGRTGHYNETGLLKNWPDGGPDLIISIIGVGKGHSQPIFVEDKIFITGIKKDTVDMLSAFTLKGELLWETPYGRSWTGSYKESRSTPTYENGNLFVSSGTGQLNRIDAASGKILWQENIMAKYNGKIHTYGDAESPLVIDNLVIFVTGGEENTLVALNKNYGSLVWKTKSLGGAKSYASPVIINHNKRIIILVQTTDNIIAVNPDNGDILWSYNLIQYHLHKQGVGAHTNPPLYFNNEIFVTSGNDHPGVMLSLSEDGNSVKLKWKNEIIDTQHGGVVVVGGTLYESNWHHNSFGHWVSVDWKTGLTNWEEEWFNKGSIIYADEMLYLYEEKSGNVALVEPSNKKLKIISTFKVKEGQGPHWAHPAIFDGKLFIRHGDMLMVYRIR